MVRQTGERLSSLNDPNRRRLFASGVGKMLEMARSNLGNVRAL